MNHLEFFLTAQQCVNREWYQRELVKAIHPCVVKAYELIKPIDWQQLLLEHPHVSSDGRLAYTRDENKGIADIQTVTTVGKYLTRHFALPDHVIRNIASIKIGDEFRIVDDMATMMELLAVSPKSCMVNGWDFDERHPYNCYDPKFGWSMAFRIVDGVVMARALLNDGVFIRTFGRGNNDCNYSQADTALETWLQSENYEFNNSWEEGTKLALISSRKSNGFVAPYIDGDNNKVRLEHDFLVIDSDGDYECNCQDGSAEQSNSCQCESCGDRMHQDEAIYSERDNCEYCEQCYSERFVHAYGRRGRQEECCIDDCIEFNNEWYDVSYLGDNNIVELDDGDYASMDDAFCCEISEQWYLTDECVRTEDDKTCHVNYTWTCVLTNNIWSNDIDGVRHDDGFAHPEALEEWNEINEKQLTLELPTSC